jgi:ABC-type transport system involved in Fe-S cluster assembly fused permease/ATPase subunit
MGFWGWYFTVVGVTGVALVVYFWIRWHQLIATMHRDALDAKLNAAARRMDEKTTKLVD